MPDTYMTPRNFWPYPWMEHAHQELGEREIRGRRHNSRIVDYLRSVGLGGGGDETAWCSAFVNWCLVQSGFAGTDRANARSWLGWGTVRAVRPTYGSIAVLWRVRRGGWQGHVGFYVGETDTHITLLGGNQGNSVSIRDYPRRRLLGYRWPQWSSPPIM